MMGHTRWRYLEALDMAAALDDARKALETLPLGSSSVVALEGIEKRLTAMQVEELGTVLRQLAYAVLRANAEA
jgi:hypothetical protein